MIVIGLLRAVNVGGAGLLPMAKLREALEEAGGENAKTLLQSGNFVCQIIDDQDVFHGRLMASLERVAGMRPEVYLRSAAEWTELVDSNPFPEFAENHPSKLLAFVGGSLPTQEVVDQVLSERQGSEQLAVSVQALYAACPNGIGESSLAKSRTWRKAIQNLTGRNWNTVGKLLALAEALQPMPPAGNPSTSLP